MADTPQPQALLEDLTDPSAIISEGDGNNEEDTAAANVQCSGRLQRGISSAVMDKEAQLSPAISTGPPERPTHTVRRAGDSMAARLGLSVVHRSAPRSVVDAPQLPALLEDLTDPSATISEGDGNNEEDTAAANVQRSGRLQRGISSAVMDEEAQFSPAISTGPPERSTHTVRHAGDSMVRRIGLSVEHRSAPRRAVDTPQLQALPEDLADPSATISEGEGNNEEDRAPCPTSRNEPLAKR